MKIQGFINDPAGRTTVPLFARGHARERAFTRRNIAWLLAHSFVGNVARHEVDGQAYGQLDWSNLFMSTEALAVQRLCCLFDYFDRVHTRNLDELVTFARHVFTEWDWRDDAVASSAHVVLHSDAMEVEEQRHDAAFVDFANKYRVCNLQVCHL